MCGVRQREGAPSAFHTKPQQWNHGDPISYHASHGPLERVLGLSWLTACKTQHEAQLSKQRVIIFWTTIVG